MSTLIDYAYLRAVGDGYTRRSGPYTDYAVVPLEREVAKAMTDTIKGIVGFIRKFVSLLIEWLDKQKANRMRVMKVCCGASDYLKGLV